MKQIKFRVWNKNENQYDDPSLLEVFNSNGVLGHLYDCRQEYTVIEQWTGLLDKNNKEIYEGDIVECVHAKYTYKVEYSLNEAAFVLRDQDGDFVYLSDYEVVVIGNVYENPELLK